MTQGCQLDIFLSLRLLKPFVDNVLLENSGLPHVIPLAVHLDFFFVEQVEGIILSKFYSVGILVRAVLHA